jgi:hypothetical protein
LETIFRVNFILKTNSKEGTPPQNIQRSNTVGTPDGIPPSISSDRLKGTRVGILQHQYSIENSITEIGSKQSTISEDSCLPKSQVDSTAERSSPKLEINGNVDRSLDQAGFTDHPVPSNGIPSSTHSSSALPESSVDSGSVTSSVSHIKLKKKRFPKLFDRKTFASLSFRRHKSSKHKE